MSLVALIYGRGFVAASYSRVQALNERKPGGRTTPIAVGCHSPAYLPRVQSKPGLYLWETGFSHTEPRWALCPPCPRVGNPCHENARIHRCSTESAGSRFQVL